MKKWIRESWFELLFPVGFLIVFGIMLIPLSIQAQEYDVGMDALVDYNEHELLSIPNVHYVENYREFERGFPDFWNIKKVNAYVSAEYPNGDWKYYSVIYDVETGEYLVEG